MKKYLLLALISCCSLIAAQSALADGLYVGAAVMEALPHSTFLIYSPSQNDIFKQTVSNGNLLGNLFVGYGYSFQNKLYLGTELSGSLGKISSVIKDRKGVLYLDKLFTNNMSETDYVALDLTPGYKINDKWLVYSRLGLVDGKLSISQNDVAGVTGFNNSINKIGYRFGIGIDYAISNISLGADYIYSFYNTFNTTSPRNTIYTYTPRNNMFGLHVSYNFN